MEELWGTASRPFSHVLELFQNPVLLGGSNRALQTVFDAGIDCSFSTIYLCNISAHLSKKDKYLLKILLAARKKAVTRKWLQLSPPTKTDWTNIVSQIENRFFENRRLTFSLNLRTEVFLTYWEKWIVYITSKV